MTFFIKLIIGLCLTFMAGQLQPKAVSDHEPISYAIAIAKDPIETKAFGILTNKCNVCHSKRNRHRVFTEEHMNGWSNDVYKQVFIKKRMPKAKRIKLTNNEYQELLTWISSLKNYQNGNQL